MRNIRCAITFIMLVISCTEIKAQGIKIYKSDKSVTEISYNELDSIVCYDKSSGNEDLIEFKDLGLSVKWATCNVGASSPEKYGNYYAWGEKEFKKSYSKFNYKHGSISCGGNFRVYLSEDFSANPEYDVASGKWGGSARMPTYAECKELCDNCSWQWTMLNNVSGMLVTGPNGNSIFLPAAGYIEDSNMPEEGFVGAIWTTTPREQDSQHSYCISFDSSGNYGTNFLMSYIGCCVRPVSE